MVRGVGSANGTDLPPPLEAKGEADGGEGLVADPSHLFTQPESREGVEPRGAGVGSDYAIPHVQGLDTGSQGDVACHMKGRVDPDVQGRHEGVVIEGGFKDRDRIFAEDHIRGHVTLGVVPSGQGHIRSPGPATHSSAVPRPHVPAKRAVAGSLLEAIAVGFREERHDRVFDRLVVDPLPAEAKVGFHQGAVGQLLAKQAAQFQVGERISSQKRVGDLLILTLREKHALAVHQIDGPAGSLFGHVPQIETISPDPVVAGRNRIGVDQRCRFGSRSRQIGPVVGEVPARIAVPAVADVVQRQRGKQLGVVVEQAGFELTLDVGGRSHPHLGVAQQPGVTLRQEVGGAHCQDQRGKGRSE